MTFPSVSSLEGARSRWLRLLFFALLPCATACGSPGQRLLEGRWLGDSVENVDDDQSPAATGWAKGTSFEFAGSTLTVAIPAEEPRSGTYRISSMDEREVRIAVLDAEGEQTEVQLIVDDEKHMRWLLGEGRALVLRRQ
jgi:hypothetical protein